MKKVKGVKKYAKQFLSSVDLAEVPQALAQFEAINTLMGKDKSFKNLLMSPIFSPEERSATLSFLSQKLNISEKTAKYLKYLSDVQVMGALPQISKSIVQIYLEMKKRAKAVVTTPAEIGKEYQEKLAGALKQITGRDIDLEFIMDPSLLGGVRIQVGSTMYDSSIKGQLGLLKDKLIKG